MVNNSIFRRFVLFAVLIFLCGCGNTIDELAAEKFFKDSKNASVNLFPVRVVKGETVANDHKVALELAKDLNRMSDLQFMVSDREFEHPSNWGHNQAKMLREIATAFATDIAVNPVESDYALLVEVLSNADETTVGGVHFYVCDSVGRLVRIQLTNSHWDNYKAVMPKNRHDGITVAKTMLKGFIDEREIDIVD